MEHQARLAPRPQDAAEAAADGLTMISVPRYARLLAAAL
jgi:hypothetical protein